MFTFHPHRLILAACIVSAGHLFAGSEAPGKAIARSEPILTAGQRTSHWAVDFDTAALWRVTDNTNLDYLVLPQTVSLRSPAHIRFDLEGDAELVCRTRISLIGAAIARGPESHYFGWTCSPSIEYWFNDRTYAHLSVGGGFGWIDSRGVAGGQGQDLCYSFFGHAGIRHYLSRNFAIGFGLYYQHWSNRGATDPNPGLDAMGPMIGCLSGVLVVRSIALDE